MHAIRHSNYECLARQVKNKQQLGCEASIRGSIVGTLRLQASFQGSYWASPPNFQNVVLALVY